MWYAIVAQGGYPGRKVFTSAEEAREGIIRVEQDIAARGGPPLGAVRVQAYVTRAAALRADISDTTDDSRGQRTPKYAGVVYSR